MLFDHWELVHGRRLVEAAAAETDPVRRLALFKAASIGLPHGAEVAIRPWSHNHAHAREAQQRVDVDRRAIVEQTYLELGLSAEAASRLAAMSMALLIGTQQAGESRECMTALFGELESWILSTAFSGQEPQGAVEWSG